MAINGGRLAGSFRVGLAFILLPCVSMLIICVDSSMHNDISPLPTTLDYVLERCKIHLLRLAALFLASLLSTIPIWLLWMTTRWLGIRVALLSSSTRQLSCWTVCLLYNK